MAVNPDSELEKIASENGWRIMRFDKLGRRLRIAAGHRRGGARWAGEAATWAAARHALAGAPAPGASLAP